MFGVKKLNMSKILNDISLNKTRNDIILDIIKNLITDKNRKILCMSDRIGQIEYLYNNLDNNISGKFIGKMKSAELAESRKKQVLLASYSLVIQGFDQPDINTLIFCTPRSNIEQAIGRIYRKKHTVTPMIIDFNDTSCYVFQNQLKKRESIYSTKIDNPEISYK
jgi:superfamily II DNA or RNA helicase